MLKQGFGRIINISSTSGLYGTPKLATYCIYAGKNKSRYTKAGIINGRTNAFKKAIVTLKEGDTIDFYSNI